MGNGNGRKLGTNWQAVSRLTEGSEVGNLGFVQVVCSYSVATAGLDYALKKARIRYGPEPPLRKCSNLRGALRARCGGPSRGNESHPQSECRRGY